MGVNRVKRHNFTLLVTELLESYYRYVSKILVEYESVS